MLDNYPLQIYESGLVFSPSNSLVKKAYAKMAPAWATLTIHPEDNWPIHLTSFTKDLGIPTAAVYSNDGSCIAIGHARGDLLVYDVTTGSLCQRGGILDCDAIKAMAYDDTNSNILILYVKNLIEVRLCSWNLQSLQFKDVQSFPSRSELSPDAKYVSCCEDTGMRLYDVDSNGTFLLPSAAASLSFKARSDSGSSTRNPSKDALSCYSSFPPLAVAASESSSYSSSVYSSSIKYEVTFSTSSSSDSLTPWHTFSADGHGLVVQWDDGSIEVWNISERSLARTFQELRVFRGNIALSKESKILAIIEEKASSESYDELSHWVGQRIVKTDRSIKVLCVETGTLLWQIETRDLDYSQSISFFKHDLVLYSEYDYRSLLSDARTGVCLGVLPGGSDCFTRKMSFQQQLAVVDDHTVRLFDWGQLQVPNTRSLEVVQLLDNQLHVLITEIAASIEWFECWDSDTGEILWSAPSTKEKAFREGRYIVSSSYIAMARDSIVVVFKRDGSLFEQHSSFSITGEVKLCFSPDDTLLVCYGNNFAIVHDIETRKPDRTTFKRGTLSNTGPLWSDNCKRMLVDLTDRALMLYWSIKGFEELEIETSAYGQHSLSPSGTIFAYLTDGFTHKFNYPQITASGLNNYDIQRRQLLRIWNLDSKEILSTTSIELRKDEPIYLSFFPCETRILIVEVYKLSIYDTSGALLLSSEYHIPSNLLRGELTFDSDIALRTVFGILCITKDIGKGTMQEPFIDDCWVYQDNRKILWLPSDYRQPWTRWYSHGRYAFDHENGNSTVLRLEFDKKP